MQKGNRAMSEHDVSWCRSDGRHTPQFVVLFDDPARATVIFDDEATARTFYADAAIQHSCQLLGTLQLHDVDLQSAAFVDLERTADERRELLQCAKYRLPSLEDLTDSDGKTHVPDDISPLLEQSYLNGRFIEADWWLRKIRSALPPKTTARPDPIAYANRDDIESLPKERSGRAIGVSLSAEPLCGMDLALYARSEAVQQNTQSDFLASPELREAVIGLIAGEISASRCKAASRDKDVAARILDKLIAIAQGTEA